MIVIELHPYFESKPWAGDKLKNIFNLSQSVGEAWILSAIKGKESKLDDGSLFSEFVKKNRAILGLNSNDEFPTLIKIIDAVRDLSIQLHPDDEYALKKGYKHGKFECRYVLEESKAKEVIDGIKDVPKEDLKKAIFNKTLTKYLIYKKIKPGDLIKIVPGTVHAILGGSFFLEVQDPLDVTYRLYDYDRLPRRELHIQDSLNMIYKSKSPCDKDKYSIEDVGDSYKVSIKNYDKFFIKVLKNSYKTFLIVR
jgi:mannose-6-phosphate isomerase